MLNAIGYVLDNGIMGYSMPHDFPLADSVYYYFKIWRDNGLLEQIHDPLHRAVHEQSDREPLPNAVIIDS
ncbi:MAG: hypothetical protein DLM69_05005 [Candidatus Chloroheliales bacterium]|nr:MAG: hypothetical protein DLM69_05005 [Chloroflexota bacterium]